MEETEESNANRKCTSKTRSFRGKTNPHKHQYQHQLLQHSNRFGFYNQNQYQSYPALLPLPPPIPLQLTITPAFPPNQSFVSKTRLQKPSWKQNNPPLATSSDTQVPVLTVSPEILERVCGLVQGTYELCSSKNRDVSLCRIPQQENRLKRHECAF